MSSDRLCPADIKNLVKADVKCKDSSNIPVKKKIGFKSQSLRLIKTGFIHGWKFYFGSRMSIDENISMQLLALL